MQPQELLAEGAAARRPTGSEAERCQREKRRGAGRCQQQHEEGQDDASEKQEEGQDDASENLRRTGSISETGGASEDDLEKDDANQIVVWRWS